MGSGTYYAVGWGIPELPEMDEKTRERLGDIFDEHLVRTSYENSSKYAVIILLDTRNDYAYGSGSSIPSGMMPVNDLAAAIKRHCEKGLPRVKDTWETVHAQAVNIGVVLPQPQLLWYADYD